MGELIRPFCIMLLYQYLLHYGLLLHIIYQYLWLFSYFIRFTMKRGDAGSWNSGWKGSKYWKPILHSSKNHETPRKSVLELIRIIERRKHKRGPTPWPGGWGHAHPYWAHPPVSWAPCWPSGVHLLLHEGFYPGKHHKKAHRTNLRRHEAEPI